MRSRYLTATLLVTALLAGCGGSDSTDSSPAASAASAAEQTEAPASDDTAAAETPAVTETPAVDTPAVTSEAPDTSVEAEFSGEGAGEFCKLLVEFGELPDPLESTLGDEVEPAVLEQTVVQYLDALNKLNQAAPAEVKSEMQLFADAFGISAKFFAQFDYDLTALGTDPAALDQYTAELEALGTDVTFDGLEAYSTDVCGLPES
jgi:hypothetical protein